MKEIQEIQEIQDIQKINLSIAACRVLRPVYSNPLDDQRNDYANKILEKINASSSS